ncbi:MAG: hypothetical protein A2Z71_08580 [Chloroflexi bacterium RBG_13_50_21]|nr:MAG: hypothetical protein A2Z71_08580 [Chloroflexi bacterium RBG_13_50_21]OGO65844.1 MAG: hypothetical protein A2030_05275 [Chloroflexi bacterium RBG_19FT_COMBO_50_10]
MQNVAIKIKGKVDESWVEWFEGFQLVHQEPDETILTGLVVDQAAFYGLIGKLRDLGLEVLAVNSTEQPRTSK